MDVRQVMVKRLGSLPVLMAYLERLKLRERVDVLAPVRRDARLTNGQVVEALVLNRLTAPRPLYDIVAWAKEWAVEAVLDVPAEALNDDRLGGCLDDLAVVRDQLRGEVTVQAVAAFGLETRTLRWDLTSVLFEGAYPAEEQDRGFVQVQYGYSSGDQKQVRYLQVTTDDGAVPVWEQPHDGSTADVATVVQTLEALREHARCQDFVLIGDSKLLSATNRRALLSAELGYLAPLPRTPELDAAFLAIPPEQFRPLAYVSAHEQRTPVEQRASYQGWETTATVTLRRPKGQAGGTEERRVRRLFVISSEERDACRRNRVRADARRAAVDRAEEEIARVLRQVGSRWYPTAERAAAKVATILDRRRLRELYQVTIGERDGQPTVTCTPLAAGLERTERLDGYYVLETTRTIDEADASALLAEWNGQWQIEHRHRNAKGPLRIRPLFVTSNRRVEALVTILGLALLVFSLIERAARRALAAGQKVPNLLAGHVAARPTGENILKALREIALVTFDLGGLPARAVAELTNLQQTLLRLLAVPATAYTALNS